MKYIIYLLTNKHNGKQYIGQHATDNVDDGYMGTGILITKAVKELGKDAFTKDILCYCKDRDELNEKEIEYIAKYGTNKNGYNITKGGKGLLGYEPSADTITKGSASRKQFYIEHPEMRELIGSYSKQRVGEKNSFYGHKLSKEHILKMTEARVRAITGAKNPSAKAVVCIETGKSFLTATMAAQSLGNKDMSSIIKCCRGRAKTAHGYHWKYLNA